MRFIHLQVLIDSVTAVARQGLKHEFGDIDRFILLAANSKPKLVRPTVRQAVADTYQSWRAGYVTTYVPQLCWET